MDPNDPWAIPPLATKGDDDLYTTFGAVGAALTDWERFEGYLSLIFTALIGLGDEETAARRAYGTIVAFGGRLGMLRAAAEAYFAEHPEPQLEADLSRLFKDAQRAAQRRNDIAHGVVQPIDPSKTFLTGAEFTLVPSFYATAKRDLKHVPKYSYSSKELSAFMIRFCRLADEAFAFLNRIYSRHPKQP